MRGTLTGRYGPRWQVHAYVKAWHRRIAGGDKQEFFTRRATHPEVDYRITLVFARSAMRGTVGIPATGISYSDRIAPGRKLMTSEQSKGVGAATILGWVIIVVCFCVVLYRLTG